MKGSIVSRILPLFVAALLVAGSAWLSIRCQQLQPPTSPQAVLDSRAVVMAPQEFLRLSAINLNTATPDELETLPKVGLVLAGRIAAYRQEHGPFASVWALDEVKGIGPKTVQQLEQFSYAE